MEQHELIGCPSLYQDEVLLVVGTQHFGFRYYNICSSIGDMRFVQGMSQYDQRPILFSFARNRVTVIALRNSNPKSDRRLEGRMVQTGRICGPRLVGERVAASGMFFFFFCRVCALIFVCIYNIL